MGSDDERFTALVERHRRELQVHCYRMLGSFEGSEDAVQETFLRAWRYRASAGGAESGGNWRAWLYRIATNTCLDAIARRPEGRRTAVSAASAHPPAAAVSEVPWLQPYPDALINGAVIDAVPDPDDGPDAVAVARETIELAFLAAVQHLPPRQRAVLILRDVVGWRAADTAALLDTTVSSVNSALQRARVTLREHLPERRAEWTAATGPTNDELAVVKRFVAAAEGSDPDAFAELLAEHARQTMPPLPYVNEGRAAMLAAWREVITGPRSWGEWRCVPVRVNLQPAYAGYLRARQGAVFPDGSSPEPGDHFAACTVNVLRLDGGLLAEVTTFGPEMFGPLGLPDRM